MSTTIIKAHFDGKTLVPDEPVKLPVGKPLRISVEVERTKPRKKRKGHFVIGKNPVNLGIPDASVNPDKYLYPGS